MTSAGAGTVYFVGAGPGDPALMTLRGREILERADVVLYDCGLDPELLRFVPAGAERLVVGREEGARQVGARLVEAAARHRVVVRLAAGDPFVLGRGGGEAGELIRAGVAFEVVPGIPSALAAPVYAGLAVTDADTAGGVILLDGDRLLEVPAPRWRDLAMGQAATFVICIGRSTVKEVCRVLGELGLRPETPLACVASAGKASQRTAFATLSDVVAGRDVAAGLEGPLVCVLGSAASRAGALPWFERRPLFGRRVVVTRSRVQAAELVRALRELGATTLEFPTLRVKEAPDREALRSAAADLERCDWVVFTSVNGVAALWSAVRALGRDARAFGASRVAAIGPGTAAALAARGIHPDVVPREYVAEAALSALAEVGPWQGRRVLLPRAAGARDVLPRGLERLGARVHEVVAYVAEPDRGDVEALREELSRGRVDVITFTASSTVRNFVAAVGARIGGAAVAAIGPVTARTARELGLPVHIEARDHTIAGLVAAIREHFLGATRAG